MIELSKNICAGKMQPVPERYSKLMQRAVTALLEQDQNARSSANRFLDWYTSAREKIREAELALRGGVGGGRAVDGRRDGAGAVDGRTVPAGGDRAASGRDLRAGREGERQMRGAKTEDRERWGGGGQSAATMVLVADERKADTEHRRERETERERERERERQRCERVRDREREEDDAKNGQRGGRGADWRHDKGDDGGQKSSRAQEVAEKGREDADAGRVRPNGNSNGMPDGKCDPGRRAEREREPAAREREGPVRRRGEEGDANMGRVHCYDSGRQDEGRDEAGRRGGGGEGTEHGSRHPHVRERAREDRGGSKGSSGAPRRGDRELEHERMGAGEREDRIKAAIAAAQSGQLRAVA